MLVKRLLLGLAVSAILFAGLNNIVSAGGKRTANFKVKIENIGTSDGIATADGSKYPFALSPGLFVVNHKKQWFFDEGGKAGKALELQAEDGNPEQLSKRLITKVGSLYLGVFNTPAGSDKPGPLLPGGSYEFNFTASEGMRLNLVAMFGQSNDLFYAPKSAIELFDKEGNPLAGDITEKLLLWDAGTEVNQAPGVGDEQAPRQKMPDTGKSENGVVRLVNDGFVYPNTRDVLRVTITAQ